MGISEKGPVPDNLQMADFKFQQNKAGVLIHITCPQGQTVYVRLCSCLKGYRLDYDPQVYQSCPYHIQERSPTREKAPIHRC